MTKLLSILLHFCLTFASRCLNFAFIFNLRRCFTVDYVIAVTDVTAAVSLRVTINAVASADLVTELKVGRSWLTG